MRYRQPAYAIIPVHRSGMRAPAIMVTADNYDSAKKEAAKRSHLFKTYPETWSLI